MQPANVVVTASSSRRDGRLGGNALLELDDEHRIVDLIVPPVLAESPFCDALDVARIANFTADELEIYDQAKIAEQDARGALSLAERHGREVGRKEGREEGLADGLRRAVRSLCRAKAC